MRPGVRRSLQRALALVDARAAELREIRTGDALAGRFASFGKGSRILAPQAGLSRPDCVTIGDRVEIRAHIDIEVIGGARSRPSLRIGDGVTVGANVRFVVFNGIDIGEEAGLGYGCTVADTVHDWTVGDPSRNPGLTPLKTGPPLRIGPGAWVGHNCVLLGGITVGARTIVGANTVLTRSVPPETIVAGNPARFCGSLAELRRFYRPGDQR